MQCAHNAVCAACCVQCAWGLKVNCSVLRLCLLETRSNPRTGHDMFHVSGPLLWTPMFHHAILCLCMNLQNVDEIKGFVVSFCSENYIKLSPWRWVCLTRSRFLSAEWLRVLWHSFVPLKFSVDCLLFTVICDTLPVTNDSTHFHWYFVQHGCEHQICSEFTHWEVYPQILNWVMDGTENFTALDVKTFHHLLFWRSEVVVCQCFKPCIFQGILQSACSGPCTVAIDQTA